MNIDYLRCTSVAGPCDAQVEQSWGQWESNNPKVWFEWHSIFSIPYLIKGNKKAWMETRKSDLRNEAIFKELRGNDMEVHKH